MNKHINKTFLIAIAGYFLIKFLGPLLFVNAGLAGLLVKTLPPPGLSLVDYQMGFAEEFFGVVSQLYGGVLFTLYAFYFLKEVSLRQFVGSIFVYLILTKCEILFWPPYGDPIGGPWVEGVWLARHNFNYAGLAAQPGYFLGGPKVYVLSIYPGFLALLMKLIPSVKIFLLVNHLLTFAMSAVIVAIVRKISKEYFEATIALLIAAIVLALPLFQSQTEAINMEIPSAFFLMLTIYALSKRKFGQAVLFALLDTLTKGSGLIACGTVVIVVCIDALLGKNTASSKKKNLIYGASIIAFTIMQVLLKYLFHDSSSVYDMGFLHGWEAVKSTYIFKLIVFSWVVCGIVLLLSCKGQGVISVLKEIWAKYYSAFLFFIATFNWVLLFINFSGLSPRYKIMLCGLLVFCLVFTVRLLVNSSGWMKAILWFVLGITLLSTYGLLESRPTETHYYEYLSLDRSLEYRNDMKMYIKVTKKIDEHYSDYAVGAPFIMVHALAIPELGYVTHKLRAMSYATTVQYEGIKEFSVIEDIDPMRTIWVGFKGNINGPLAEVFPDFPIDRQQDLILGPVGSGNRYATLFMGGFAVDRYQKAILYLIKSGHLQSQRELSNKK